MLYFTIHCMQVVIGELRPGACVGEGMLRGSEQQPYQVTTTTKVRIGWVSASIIRSRLL